MQLCRFVFYSINSEAETALQSLFMVGGFRKRKFSPCPVEALHRQKKPLAVPRRRSSAPPGRCLSASAHSMRVYSQGFCKHHHRRGFQISWSVGSSCFICHVLYTIYYMLYTIYHYIIYYIPHTIYYIFDSIYTYIPFMWSFGPFGPRLDPRRRRALRWGSAGARDPGKDRQGLD